MLQKNVHKTILTSNTKQKQKLRKKTAASNLGNF